VPARAAEEEGFGLIELLFAMVMLNIGILALVAAFQTGAVALARSSSVSSGTAVADKVMEVYRGFQSCAIYLSAPASGGADTGTPALPNGIPNATSTWYTRYKADLAAYPGVGYFDYTSATKNWVTNLSGAQDPTSIAPCPTAIPTLPNGSPDPTKAVQYVTGPDGQSYPVFTYIIAVQPKDAAGNVTAGWLKQVTVTVWNPRSTTQMLARETSYFDPNVSG
jgi:type II secretory pathway pseudopilin PulG